MSYVVIYNAAIDEAGTLRKQVSVAIRKAATDVRAEDPQTANHARRLQWANQSLTSSGISSMTDSMIWFVLENATIQANPGAATDSDVQFVVNSLVNQFAGE
jgi:predicted metal-dependent HD superfamily phosphohydrolase